MKKFVTGFLCCFVLMSSIAFAATQLKADISQSKIYVDNKEYTNTDKPAVIIDGSTYLPLRSLGNVLKVPVTWNETDKSISIGQMPVTKSQDGLELTIFNHGKVYTNGSVSIAVDFELKNNSNTVQKFSPRSFLFHHYPATAFESQLAGSKHDVELMPGENYKDSMLFGFIDVGPLILKDEKSYDFVFMCGSTRIEIIYSY